MDEVNAITEYDQLNADNLKIGWWIRHSRINPNNYHKIFYYIDESGKSREKWGIGYNESDEITEVRALSGIDHEGISNVQYIEGQLYLKLMSPKQ